MVLPSCCLEKTSCFLRLYRELRSVYRELRCPSMRVPGTTVTVYRELRWKSSLVHHSMWITSGASGALQI